jgi:hypothetical protein
VTRRQNPTPDPGIFQVFNERSGDFSILARTSRTPTDIDVLDSRVARLTATALSPFSITASIAMS